MNATEEINGKALAEMSPDALNAWFEMRFAKSLAQANDNKTPLAHLQAVQRHLQSHGLPYRQSGGIQHDERRGGPCDLQMQRPTCGGTIAFKDKQLKAGVENVPERVLSRLIAKVHHVIVANAAHHKDGNRQQADDRPLMACVKAAPLRLLLLGAQLGIGFVKRWRHGHDSRWDYVAHCRPRGCEGKAC